MSLLSSNLQAFLAITKTRTVHGAAKQIGITQTGVTQRIRALESELSSTLFIRSRRGMSLTPEGEALLRYCSSATELEGEALASIQGAAVQRKVEIVITGPTSILNSRIIPQCIPLYNEFDKLFLSYRFDDLDSRIETLRSGAAQFAIVAPEQVVREMDSKRLKPEKYVLVGSPKWKGRSTREIIQKERIIDFDPTDKMSFSYLRKYKLLDRMNPDRIFANQNEALIQLFSQGVGYGVLTLEVAKPWMDSGQLILLNSGGYLENPIALAWYPRPQIPPYLEMLIRAIK
jgi:DNA-binding transcriptional LysR family regulator